MNLDTVIVMASVEQMNVERLNGMIRVETHAGKYRFLAVPPERAVAPISLLGKRLMEAVLELYGPDQLWHPFWCRCSDCQESARLEQAYEDYTARLWGN